jgi:hypothetical protein
LVLFEDPQCSYCRRFEERSGDLLRREIAAGSVNVEYRMRSFLGPESVRADNALALAAETGHFDQLRSVLFSAQPDQGTGGYTADDLIQLGRQVGITSSDFAAGVREGRYQQWVECTEEAFEKDDPDGTPAGLLDGRSVEPYDLYDPEALGSLIRR